jgi:hypothetical protein
MTDSPHQILLKSIKNPFFSGYMFPNVRFETMQEGFNHVIESFVLN